MQSRRLLDAVLRRRRWRRWSHGSIRPDSASLSVDSGKGQSKLHAKASAAMEALERWALDEVPIEWTEQKASGEIETRFPAIRGAAPPAPYHKACVSFDLSTGQEIQVPYYCVKMYNDATPVTERIFCASTNGMASGNTREEAIASGLFEVIERDAMSLAMSKDNPPRVDVGSSTDPFTHEALEKIRRAGCELFTYDCRSDVGIPVFLSIITDRDRGVGLYKGYGCHLSPDIALNRSICEAAQARCVVMAGARDDITWKAHRQIIGNTEAIDWVVEFGKTPASTRLSDMSDLSTGSTHADIDKAIAMLALAGFERVLVVEFPVPDAPFSCVKVLIPKMAGYKFLHGINPGRVLEPGRPG